MRKMKKPAAIALACALCCAIGIGGTLAWLTDTSGPVENTFTVGNIDIDLEETKSDFKMVPGCTIEKDPVVTVFGGSEDCWLFVQVQETGGEVTLADGAATDFDDFVGYSVITGTDGWAELGAAYPGVWYRKVAADAADQSFDILTGNKVAVRDTVTKEMMDKLEAAYQAAEDANKGSGKAILPNLTLTAYAVQLYKTNGVEFAPADAWALANS